MKPKKLLSSCLFIFLMHMMLFADAQNSPTVTISGTVVDERNETIPSALVRVRGANLSTVTDLNGKYSIKVKEDPNIILEFSFLGYSVQTVRISPGRLIYNIKLQPDALGLNEVLVIGYGTSTKKDLTGSVGSVSMKDLEKAPVPSFDQALAGRVAGVTVTANDGQPGADMSIVIRGNNSVTQDNSPLFVVDGFPLEASLASVINPNDIESIDVLKDASATAIYGARGANGVIMITTKRGKTGVSTISYNSFVGYQSNLKKQELLNPFEFVKLQIELNPTLNTPRYLNNGLTLDSYRDIKGIDWQDEIIKVNPFQNHALSISGGTDKTKYLISGSFVDQDGIIINSGFNRYQGKVSLDQTLSEKFKTGLQVNYTNTKRFGQVVGQAATSPTSTLLYSAFGYRPVSGNIDDQEDLIDVGLDPDINPDTDFRFNPLKTVQNTFNPRIDNAIFTNAYLEYSILPNLLFRTTGGLTRSQVNFQQFFNSNTQSGHPLGIRKVNGSVSNRSVDNYANENILTFTKKVNSHDFSVLGGFSVYKTTLSASGYSAVEVPNESLGISGLDEGILTFGESTLSSNTLASFFSRATYNYKSKYLLTTTFRADGSSKFSENNRWAYFPSTSVAWRISEESFMKPVGFISDAKVRAGYGLTGNNRVGDFSYLSSYTITPASGYSNNNSPFQGIIPGVLGNPTLRWESTGQTDIGLDIAFFNSRIALTVDYYKKVTSDLLLNATLAPSQGYLAGLKNIGKVSNEGLEFTLNTVNLKSSNFSWASNFNISFNRNKVLGLNEGQASLLTPVSWGNFGGVAPYIAIPGHPIALYYGYTFDGVYQYEDFDKLPSGAFVLKSNIPNNGQPRTSITPGVIKYKDINGDGVVNGDDQAIIGNPNPIHTGGLSNNISFKNFDLNVFFQWSYGNDILNVNRINFEGGETRNNLNQFASVANRWTPTNPTNELFRAGGQGPTVYSSRIIEDGSFLRLKTLNLGYNFSDKLIGKAKIRSLRVYISGQNLLTWTNYSGMDPEVSVRNSALTPGFDLSAYPMVRTLTAGLNITL
jgi:TonB-linked SusC/RagA family outer membrane protein